MAPVGLKDGVIYFFNAEPRVLGKALAMIDQYEQDEMKQKF